MRNGRNSIKRTQGKEVIMSIASRVKSLRAELGLTQYQLAELVNVAQTAIQKIESGSTSNPRNIEEIAKALKCSPEFLRFGSVETTSKAPIIKWDEISAYLQGVISVDKAKTLNCPISHHAKDLFVLEAPWLTMKGQFLKGDLIFIERGCEYNNGDYVLVSIKKTHEIALRQVFIESSDTHLLFRSSESNPCDAMRVDSGTVKVIGRAICTTRILN